MHWIDNYVSQDLNFGARSPTLGPRIKLPRKTRRTIVLHRAKLRLAGRKPPKYRDCDQMLKHGSPVSIVSSYLTRDSFHCPLS